MTTASAGPGGRGTPPRRALFRSPYLLVLLGFAVASFYYAIYGATADAEALSSPGRGKAHTRQENSIALRADRRLNGGVESERDFGMLAPSVRVPGEDTDRSSPMIAHHRREDEDLTQGGVDGVVHM